MPTDPMLVPLSTDSKAQAHLDKALFNFQKRHWWHRTTVTADATVDNNTEWLDCDTSLIGTGETNFDITLPLAANAPGQVIVVHDSNIGGGTTVTVVVETGETIGGVSTKVMGPDSGNLNLIMICSDGVSDWTMMIEN